MKKTNLVYIHGLGVSEKHSNLIFQYLGKRNFNIISIGLPGSPTCKYKRLTSINQWAAWLDEKLKTLDVEDYILIGWSFGGLVIQQYAQKHRDRKLQGVVCWSTPFYGIQNFVKVAYNLFLKVHDNETFKKTVRVVIENLEKNGVALSQQDIYDIEHSDPRFMLNGISVIEKFKSSFQSANFKQLIIADPFDVICSNKTIENLENAVKSSTETKLQIIKHSGHGGTLIGIENANIEIQSFIKSLRNNAGK
jgi:pimeloyl-ACP methyl ester carboxylesterase